MASLTTESAAGDTMALQDNAQAEQERAVGTDVFISPDAPGFECIVKQRYTDFLVNEILPNGHVLHLTETSTKIREVKEEPESKRNGVVEEAPVQAGQKRAQPGEEGLDEAVENGATAKKLRLEPGAVEDETSKENGEAQSAPNVDVDFRLSEEDSSRLNNIFGNGVTSDIARLYTEVLQRPDRKPRDHRTITSDPIDDKAKRTEAHDAVRTIFASKLETSTLQDGSGAISIRAAPPKTSNNKPKSQDLNAQGAKQKGRLGWDQLGGEYLHFTLYKENKDTMEVLYFMASQLKLAIKNFQFAGTKDRRGVTVQRVCVYRVHADRLMSIQRLAKGWRVSSFEYKKHGLQLGELMGNEFLLTLRDCRFPGDEGLDQAARIENVRYALAKATAAFADKGFLNYYGLQRFGSLSTGTHHTGVKMLQGNLEAAVDCILAYNPALLPENQDQENPAKVPEDDIKRAEAIRIWNDTKDAHEACAKMPRRFQAEFSIIQYLGKKEKRSGRLAQEKDWQGALMQIQRNLRLMYVHAYQSFVWNTVAGRRWNTHGSKVMEGDLVIVGKKDGVASAIPQELDEDGEPIIRPADGDTAPSAEQNFTRARPLSREEAESGKYNIFDVVLPLPGFDVVYPDNEIGAFYKTFMASDAGGGLDPHNMRRSWKDISLSGGYRKMMSRPSNLVAEVREYATENEQLVQTDLERINGGQNGHGKTGEEELMGEKKLAVVLKMQLGSSQYATMALRELTKGGAANFRPDFNTAR